MIFNFRLKLPLSLAFILFLDIVHSQPQPLEISSLFEENKLEDHLFFNPFNLKNGEYNLDGIDHLVVRIDDRREKLRRNQTADPIFISEFRSAADSLTFWYRNDKLVKQIEKDDHTFFYYDDDSLKLIERRSQRLNDGPVIQQFQMGKLNDDKNAACLKITKNIDGSGKIRWEHFTLFSTAVEAVLMAKSKYENGSEKEYQLIREFNADGKIEKEYELVNGNKVSDVDYTHQMVNGIPTTTLVDQKKPKYAFRIQYDSLGRIIEQGIYERELYSGELKFLVLNKITYSEGGGIITEYQNTFYNANSMKKNIRWQYVVNKTAIKDRLPYQWGNQNTPPYSVFYRTPIRSGLLKEIAFKNGRQDYQIVYNYLYEDDYLLRVEGLIDFAKEEIPRGLIYLYERDVRD